MDILFLHDNFPAQFGRLGQYLNRAGWRVRFATRREGVAMDGVEVVPYKPHREVTKDIHPYAGAFEKAVLNGQAAARAALALKDKGVRPDLIVAHSGWGPGFYMKDVWPDAKLVGYYEWYYNSPGPDVAFLNDDAPGDHDRLRARSRNAPILMDLAHGDAGLCPTNWQQAQFPPLFRDKLAVHHDGVDTAYFAPKPGARLKLPNLDLSQADEIITYVARGMEPYRGFPQFMEALAHVQKMRPGAHGVIVGADRIAYGAALPEGESYKTRALETLDLDPARTHFTGLLPRDQYRAVLQASSVHIYLTVPFVLSWSMMEAMSAGCLLIASDTSPVREVVSDGKTGLLTDFFDTKALAEKIADALEAPEAYRGIRAAARQTISEHYAVTKLFPQKKAFLEAVAAGLG
ncbi:MAG: glycosyltransferase [Pseudomonadota bacterium]